MTIVTDTQDVERSTFVGRRHEIADVRRQILTTRLLTLTGAGGVGKTRLAEQAVQGHLSGAFPDGVALVRLAALEDASLVESAVAASLGLRDTGHRPLAVLVRHLTDKRMLLVLDNCEHVLTACARLAEELLRAAPHLRILATSRQALAVLGERVLLVPSLSVPDPHEGTRRIARHDAVRLLVERAAPRLPGFAVHAGNAPALARLVRRLDGIPLAIELAAANLHTTTPEQLISDLDAFFDAPPDGTAAKALPRHQTLRATMDWSFRLCSPAERRLWSRLSIFAGDIGLEAAETICAADGTTPTPPDILPQIIALVDKSVLVADRSGEGVHYRMLEGIREYGRQQLPVHEDTALRHRYSAYHHDLVQRLRIDHLGPEQLSRCRALHRELPNIRAALECCMQDQALAERGLETAAALWSYWIFSGAITEGRYWLELGLDLVREPCPPRRTALWVAGLYALAQDDATAAARHLHECLALARDAGDETCLAHAVQISGVAAFTRGDLAGGLALLEEAVGRHRILGDLSALAIALYFAAQYGAAVDVERATAYGEEFLALTERHHAQLGRCYALYALGTAAWNRADFGRAQTLIREAARLRQEMGDRWGVTECLEMLAWTAGAQGQHERAARTLGAAHTMWCAIGVPPRQQYHIEPHRRCEEQARGALGERVFTAAFRRGARLSPDQAVAYAARGDAGP